MALSSESNTASSAQTPSNLAIALGVARGRLFASFAGHLYVVDHTAIVRLWDVGRDPDAGRVSGAVGRRCEVGEERCLRILLECRGVTITTCFHAQPHVGSRFCSSTLRTFVSGLAPQ